MAQAGALAGRVAVVPGGGAGIGAAIARLFAAEGARVALAELDQRNALAELQVPCLVVVGDADAVVPPDIGRAAAELAPDSQLVEMPGCGHAMFIEDAPAYREAVDRFLSALG